MKLPFKDRFLKIGFNVVYRIKVAIFRPVFEYFGVQWFSRTEIMGLDKIIDKYLNFSDGYFLEVGAGDGILLSNTYYLERFKNWQGILVEPSSEMARKCALNRKKSQVFECALVNKDYSKPTIELTYAGLATITKGAVSVEEERALIKRATSISFNIRSKAFVARARTLDSVLRESKIPRLDFLSVDVEGFESEVLAGMNFKKWKPRYLLFEAQNPSKLADVQLVIGKIYKNCLQVSEIDYLCF